MSNDTTTSGATTKRLPQFEAFSVRKYKKNGEHRTARTRIGAAWEHGDGKGCDIILECFPVNGRLTLRRVETEEAQPDHV
jgi:hypothetical protein